MFKKTIGNHTYLALLESRHAAAMSSLINENRTHLRQWLPWVDITRGVPDSRLWIDAALNKFAQGRELHAGIWVEHSLAGVIGCRFAGQNNSSTIGYWLGQEYQGRGLMHSACRALIGYSFTELALNKVEIRCAEKNLRSRAIPERLGFKQEGRIRDAEWLYDHYVDHIVYGLLAREWIKGICPDLN